MNPTPQEALQMAFEILGDSASAMALAIGGDLKRQNVEHWIKVGRVPAAYAPSIEDATTKAGRRITCEQLCPDVRWSVVRTRSPRAKVAA